MNTALFELEKAICAKLKADSEWYWPIYRKAPGTPKYPYVEINMISADNSAKQMPINNITAIFDIWDNHPSADTGTNQDCDIIVMKTDRILTLTNSVAGFTPLVLSGGYTDVNHLPDGYDFVPNIDPAITHARRRIIFTIAG